MKTLKRCDWVSDADSLMQKYHDTEWGVVVKKDSTIFEFLVLESFQAGLSWQIILNKRENFRKTFANFDPQKIATFSSKEVNQLLQNVGIVRNKAKIEATINNAKRFLEVQKEFTTFSKYMWQFVDNQPINHIIKTKSDYIAVNDQAIAFAKDLKKRGFKFLGPTTVYAHMQAVGMVNDHMQDCFRKKI